MSAGGIARSQSHRRAAWLAPALLAVAGLLVAACSGAAATPVPATPTSAVKAATASPTAVPTKGPATQHLTLAGSAGAAISVTNAAIRCSFPASDGTLQISVLAQPSDPNLSVYIFVSAGNVSVRFDSGSGSTYVERDFAGTGVTKFDAATGAQVDSALTETATNIAHGTLGTLTHLTGSIDCGNQTPGTSTLIFSGETPKGTLSGGLSPVSVQCTTSSTTGSSISIIGIGMVGTTPTEIIMSVSPNTFTVYPVLAGFYRNTNAAVATLTATGAHIEGDATEQSPAAGTKAHTVHVSGDVVCGLTVGG